jgi:hypothetical protein
MDPWRYIIREFNGEVRACLRVYHIVYDVWQSTTSSKTLVDKKDRKALIIRCSCCFYDRNVGLVTGAAMNDDIT